MNKYRGKSFDGLFPPSRDPEVVQGSFEGGLALNQSPQDIPLNQSPAHDRVMIERGGLRQDYGNFRLGEAAPSRILALAENRFVRSGFQLFEKTFRLYRDSNGFPVIESWNGTAWVFEVTTTEFTIADVLLARKPFFNAFFFADGDKVFKWDNSNEIDSVGDDFGFQNSLTAVDDETFATIDPAGAFLNKYKANYKLTLTGPTFGASSVTVTLYAEQNTGQENFLVPVGLRVHQFEPSNDGSRVVSLTHEIIPFMLQMTAGLKVYLRITDITLNPVLITDLLATANPPNGNAWDGDKSSVGIARDGSYTLSFNVDDFDNTSGTAQVDIYVRYVGEEDFSFVNSDAYAAGRHTYEIVDESADIEEFRITITPITPGVWRFFNNDSDPKGTVYVTYFQVATVEVHGFNQVDDHDSEYGVSYEVEGETKNSLELVRDQGDAGEIIVGRYLGIFANRLVVLISDGDQQKARWCVNGDPRDWLGEGSGENIIPSNSDPVDTLQALEPLTSDTGVLFRKVSKMKVVATGQLEPAIAFFPWIEKIGTESPFSVIPVPDGLNYFASNKQVYFLQEGGEIQIGERIREEFLYNLAPEQLEFVEAVYKPDQQRYILCMAYGEEAAPSMHIIEKIGVKEVVEMNDPVAEFGGFNIFSEAHPCTPLGDFQQYTQYIPDPVTGNPWPPDPADDPESSDPDDTGDFEPSVAPPYTSQKNMGRIFTDPRTGTILMIRGDFGAFGETPPTSTKVLRSTDGGANFVQVANFADYIEYYTAYETFDDETPVEYSIPLDIVPGANPGDWWLFDLFGGCYFSDDDGETWSAKQMSGVGFAWVDSVNDHNAPYYCLFGIGEGEFDTRNRAVHHYLSE